MSSDVLSLVHGRRGHFVYESGHHANLWFDLETLCLRPDALHPYITQLALQIARYQPQVICGPLVEGAYVALLVAQEMGCEFIYANRCAPSNADANSLFPIDYVIPDSLHAFACGRRVAIVNDMISVGSAVRGAYFHLKQLGSEIAVVAALTLCGDGFSAFAAENQLPVESLARVDSNVWAPDQCPLCAEHQPLQSLAHG
jgi:orotate phosphoribosyltransferase